MALDATVAGESANSYLTVAEADALADSELGHNARRWILSDLGDKERALIRASWQVDAYVPRFARYNGYQALAFPRDVDLDEAEMPVIEARVRRATFLQAAYLLANADKLDEASTRRARGMISFSESDVSGAPSLDPAFGRMDPEAEILLKGFRQAGTVKSVPIRSRYYSPS